MYMGANKLETVKVLLDAGASLDFRTFTGGTCLTGAVENEDSDPDVVRVILEKNQVIMQSKRVFFYRQLPRKSTTVKWKVFILLQRHYIAHVCRRLD